MWRRLERGAVIANLAGQAKVKHGVNYASVSLARYATRARVCVYVQGAAFAFCERRKACGCLPVPERQGPGPAAPHITNRRGWQRDIFISAATACDGDRPGSDPHTLRPVDMLHMCVGALQYYMSAGKTPVLTASPLTAHVDVFLIYQRSM